MRGFKRTDADSSVLFLPKTTQYFLLSFLNIVTIFRPCPAAAYFTGTVRLSHVMLNWITKHFWHISRNIADCCNLLTRLGQIVRIPGTETKPLELSIGLRESWHNRRIFADQNIRQISHSLWGQAFPTNWVYYEISRISVDSSTSLGTPAATMQNAAVIYVDTAAAAASRFCALQCCSAACAPVPPNCSGHTQDNAHYDNTRAQPLLQKSVQFFAHKNN